MFLIMLAMMVLGGLLMLGLYKMVDGKSGPLNNFEVVVGIIALALVLIPLIYFGLAFKRWQYQFFLKDLF